MKTENKILIVAGLIFLIAAFVLTDDSKQLSDTLRGVAYEGVIFASCLAIILNVITADAEKNRQKLLLREKRESRDSLIRVLSLLCESYHSGGIVHWTKLIRYANTFETNFELFKQSRIKHKQEMHSQLDQKFFKNSCEQNHPTLLALIPVAEKISPKHLEVWAGICSIVSLAATDSVFPEILLKEFEEHVAEFAKLEVRVIE